jgi:hypothetical protein
MFYAQSAKESAQLLLVAATAPRDGLLGRGPDGPWSMSITVIWSAATATRSPAREVEDGALHRWTDMILG